MDSRNTRHPPKPTVIVCFPYLYSRSPQLPLGVYKLAQNLGDDYEIVIVDARLPGVDVTESVSEVLRSGRRTVCLGLSVLPGEQLSSAIEISKSFHGRLPIVWGGMVPTTIPSLVRDAWYVDHVICGEGEDAFLALVRHLSQGGSLPGEPASSAAPDGGPHIFGRFGETTDSFYTERLPPDYFVARDGSSRVIPLETTRGCPWTCGFCHNGTHSRKYRAKPPAVVVGMLDQIASLPNPPDGIVFQEDNFFANKGRSVAIMDHLARTKPHMNWKANARVDCLLQYLRDPEFMNLLVQSGCRVLQFGVESGSNAVLIDIDKRITVEQVVELNRLISDYQIRIRYNFIIGFPNENRAQRKETLCLIERLQEENQNAEPPFLNVYSPYPGTRLFEAACLAGFRPLEELSYWEDLTWNSASHLVWLSHEERNEIESASLAAFGKSRYLR